MFLVSPRTISFMKQPKERLHFIVITQDLTKTHCLLDPNTHKTIYNRDIKVLNLVHITQVVRFSEDGIGPKTMPA
eukprot:c20639_g1_i1 orf=584-808(-)